MRPRLALLFLALAALSCASAPTPRFATEGRDLDGVDDLRRLVNVRFRRVWARPGVSFAAYSKILPTVSGIDYLQDRPDAPRLPQHLRHRMPEWLDEALLLELRKEFGAQLGTMEGWRLATEPGPGVLALRIHLVNLIVSTALDYHTGTEVNWVDRIGNFTLVIDLVDADTNVRLARALESRDIQAVSRRRVRAMPATAINESRLIFDDWAGKLRDLLTGLRRGIEQPEQGNRSGAG